MPRDLGAVSALWGLSCQSGKSILARHEKPERSPKGFLEEVALEDRLGVLSMSRWVQKKGSTKWGTGPETGAQNTRSDSREPRRSLNHRRDPARKQRPRWVICGAQCKMGGAFVQKAGQSFFPPRFSGRTVLFSIRGLTPCFFGHEDTPGMSVHPHGYPGSRPARRAEAVAVAGSGLAGVEWSRTREAEGGGPCVSQGSKPQCVLPRPLGCHFQNTDPSVTLLRLSVQ